MPENDIKRALSAAPDPAPVGMISAWAGPTNLVPIGWLICNGDTITKNNFPALCNVIQDFWGPIEPVSGQHMLPDLRGMFIRGVNGSRNDGFTDPDKDGRTSNKGRPNDVGSTQSNELHKHAHPITDPGHNHDLRNDNLSRGRIDLNGGEVTRFNGGQGAVPLQKTGITINDTGGNETRPNNAYVYYIIKAV